MEILSSGLVEAIVKMRKTPSTPVIKARRLSKTVETADAEAPRTTADAVTVCVYTGAEVAATNGLGIEEGHGCV
ncbi:hypothetical protein LY78DRAFT_656786 [Colletotrichum sublineola]|nr:hypothetical protein LY78DRAFT_656786 [Colletotrichum sublineola]